MSAQQGNAHEKAYERALEEPTEQTDRTASRVDSLKVFRNLCGGLSVAALLCLIPIWLIPAFNGADKHGRYILPTNEYGDTSRAELMRQPGFLVAFYGATERIAKMDIRYVEERDPVRQALLEIYLALALNAKHNDFNTH